MNKEQILGEALAAIRKANYNACVILPTGTGKAKLLIDAAKELNCKKILYLCDNTDLRDTGFKFELNKWDGSHLIPKIDFVCYKSASTWEGKEYDLVLGDEFDYACTPQYHKAFTKNKFTYKVIVSATLEDKKKKYQKLIAPIVYERKTGELIEGGVLNKIRVHFVNYNLSGPEQQQYLTYNEQFKKLLAEQKTPWREKRLDSLKIARKNFLSTLITSANVCKWLLNGLRKKGEKILIFCGRASQADKVSPNPYHTENNNKEGFEAFKEGTEKELAVVEKITRGVNIPDVRHIVQETTDSSVTKGVQKRGRGLRLQPHEILNMYYLIPHFVHPWHGRKATIVRDWVDRSLEGITPESVQTITYNN